MGELDPEAVIPPGLEVTVYPRIALPPLLVGAVNATDNDVELFPVTAPIVGALGRVVQVPAWIYCAISVGLKIPFPVEVLDIAGEVAVVNRPGYRNGILC